jgi:hypothetical protein
LTCCISAKPHFSTSGFSHLCNCRFPGNSVRENLRNASFTKTQALPSGELPFSRKIWLCKPFTCLYFFSRGIPHHGKSFSPGELAFSVFICGHLYSSVVRFFHHSCLPKAGIAQIFTDFQK